MLYVFFAKTFGLLFFPFKDASTSLLASFFVFSIAYLVRPLGGLLFSHIGDTLGRIKVLPPLTLLITFATLAIGLIPTYNQIGILAPILLILFRIIQGLSFGGFIPGVLTYSFEVSEKSKRGLSTAILLSSITCGFLACSIVRGSLSYLLDDDAFYTYGWRVAFMLTLPIGLVAYQIRKRLAESPMFIAFQKAFEIKKIPFINVFRYHFQSMLAAISLMSFGAVQIILIYLYMPTYLTTAFKFTDSDVLFLNVINMTFFSTTIVFIGWLADRVERKFLLLVSSIGFICFTYPLFSFFALSDRTTALYVLLALSFFSALTWGSLPSLISELFPTPVRHTGVALSFNFGFSIVGCFVPILATLFIKFFDDNISPAYLLISIAFMSLFTVLNVGKLKNMSLSS